MSAQHLGSWLLMSSSLSVAVFGTSFPDDSVVRSICNCSGAHRRLKNRMILSKAVYSCENSSTRHSKGSEGHCIKSALFGSESFVVEHKDPYLEWSQLRGQLINLQVEHFDTSSQKHCACPPSYHHPHSIGCKLQPDLDSACHRSYLPRLIFHPSLRQ